MAGQSTGNVANGMDYIMDESASDGLRGLRRPLGPVELAAIFGAMNDTVMEFTLTYAYLSGLPFTDCLAIRQCDVNLEDGTIHMQSGNSYWMNTDEFALLKHWLAENPELPSDGRIFDIGATSQEAYGIVVDCFTKASARLGFTYTLGDLSLAAARRILTKIDLVRIPLWYGQCASGQSHQITGRRVLYTNELYTNELSD